MGISFILGVLALVALAIYLKMYAKKKSWHLDEYGTLKEEFISSYTFYKIKKENFDWIQYAVKKHFPEAYCEIKHYNNYNQHILIVTTSIYHHQYYIRGENPDDVYAHGWANIMESIYYIECHGDDEYIMYLRRPCLIGEGQNALVFKGRVIEGSVTDIKRGFEQWLQDQKAFAIHHQDRINAEKSRILAKQKEYDSQVYRIPDL